MPRTPLATLPTPQGAERSIVVLRHKLADGCKLKLLYLPDRLITTPEAFAALVENAATADTLEAATASITESFYDALVPFWLRVTAKTAEKHHSVHMMRVQPTFTLPDEYKDIVEI